MGHAPHIDESDEQLGEGGADIEDLESVDPGGAPDDRPNGARAGAFAEVDVLVARTRRSLDAFNDLQTETGRSQMALADPAYDQPGRLGAWLEAVAATANCPAALATAIALDAWLTLEPSEHQGDLGFALAAALLRQRGLAATHLPALALGLHKTRWRWCPDWAPHARLAGLLAAMTEAARLGQAAV